MKRSKIENHFRLTTSPPLLPPPWIRGHIYKYIYYTRYIVQRAIINSYTQSYKGDAHDSPPPPATLCCANGVMVVATLDSNTGAARFRIINYNIGT